MTVQERGAGLGDIFTQNTLSAIKAVCQVLALGLCGRGGALGGRKGVAGDGGGSLPTGSSAAGGPPELTLQRADVSLTAHNFVCGRGRTLSGTLINKNYTSG